MQSLPDVWGSGCDVAPLDVKGSRGRTACSDSVGPVNVVGLYILEARDGQPLPVLVYSSGSGDLFLTYESLRFAGDGRGVRTAVHERRISGGETEATSYATDFAYRIVQDRIEIAI